MTEEWNEAQVGDTPCDRRVIRGHHLGEPDRDREILEAIGKGGRPPFRVRWSETA